MNVSELGSLLLAASERKAKKEGIKRYSLRRLADDAGTVQPYLTRVVHGKSMPSRHILLRLCRALDCSLEEASEIFSKTDYREPALEELKKEEETAAA